MPALLQKIGQTIGLGSSISETDRGIIEAMIEIGADADEIATTFGYSSEVIALVQSKQSTSPYRIISHYA
jgi:hypothetical protein